MINYGVFSTHGIFTVHELRPNGSKGRRVSGHETKDAAEAEVVKLGNPERSGRVRPGQQVRG